jgi:hypothetical protein
VAGGEVELSLPGMRVDSKQLILKTAVKQGPGGPKR